MDAVAPTGQSAFQRWLESQHLGTYTYAVENAFTKMLGLGSTLDYSERRPSELGYPDSEGQEKAMRHMLLAADLHQNHPWLADPLLYGHEYVTNVLQGQRPDVRGKDLFNNSIGKYIGQRTTSRAEAEQWAQTALPYADTKNYTAGTP